jgi:hypothetical protein
MSVVPKMSAHHMVFTSRVHSGYARPSVNLAASPARSCVSSVCVCDGVRVRTVDGVGLGFGGGSEEHEDRADERTALPHVEERREEDEHMQGRLQLRISSLRVRTHLLVSTPPHTHTHTHTRAAHACVTSKAGVTPLPPATAM